MTKIHVNITTIVCLTSNFKHLSSVRQGQSCPGTESPGSGLGIQKKILPEIFQEEHTLVCVSQELAVLPTHNPHHIKGLSMGSCSLCS